MHAESVPSDPGAVRFVLPEVALPAGHLVAAPGALGELIDTGIVRAVMIEPHAVVVWIAEDQQWADHGITIQDAVGAATADWENWVVVGDPDEVLGWITRDVLAGPVGDYISGHGGRVHVVRVQDERVEIEFAGACHRCPATGNTLHARIESAIKERYPALRAVVDVGPKPSRSVANAFLLWPKIHGG